SASTWRSAATACRRTTFRHRPRRRTPSGAFSTGTPSTSPRPTSWKSMRPRTDMTPDRSKEAFVALVTCFNDDETLNYGATRAQVRRQVTAGNNIMCAGTNGDFTALTFDEKVRLCGEVVDQVGGKANVIVNSGMPATFETILLAREFE